MEDSKGKRVEYKGNYGESFYQLIPIAKNPPIVEDRFGWEYYYFGALDDEFGLFQKVVAKDSQMGWHRNPMMWCEFPNYPDLRNMILEYE